LETSGAGRAEENDLSSDGVADLVIGPEDLSAREEVVDVATLPYESDLPAGFYESNDTNVAILLSPEISYADISWALQLLPPVDHDTHSVLSPGTIERVDIHEEVKVSHEESSVFEFYLQHAGVWVSRTVLFGSPF
jgi:hypothetical protein